ncbi:hypothetical protein IMZ48_29595 [Candidatus Bathyarchaeota archaeon]|nr:hypothetical protein [Candidatus Bathyarchaeota archaeon]
MMLDDRTATGFSLSCGAGLEGVWQVMAMAMVGSGAPYSEGGIGVGAAGLGGGGHGGGVLGGRDWVMGLETWGGLDYAAS